MNYVFSFSRYLLQKKTLQSKLNSKTKNSMKNETIKLYNIKYFSKNKKSKK